MTERWSMYRRMALVLTGWLFVVGMTVGVAGAATSPPDAKARSADVSPLDPKPLGSEPRDLAEELDLPASKVSTDASDGKGGQVASEDQRVAEDIGLRSEGSETYKLQTGLRQTELFAEPRWYRDAEGEWERVDPRVSADRSQDGVLRSSGAGWSASFASTGVSVSFEGREASLAIPGVKNAARPELDQKDPTTVRYRGVWPGVDLRYRVSATGLKEDFIVSSREGFAAAGNFTVAVTSQGRLIKDDRLPGGFLLDWDGDGKTARDDPKQGPRIEFPPPVVADASGGFLGNDQISFVTDAREDGSTEVRARTLGIAIPQEWIDKLGPEQYPVTVDPSTTIIPSSMGGSWASYNSAGNLSQGTSQWGLLGNWRVLGGDDYWRFSVSPGYQYLWNSVASNARVFGANLKLDTVAYPTAVSPFTGSNYPTSSVSEGVTVCQASAWNYGGAYPGYSGTCNDQYWAGFQQAWSVIGAHSSSALVDVTSLVRPWVANHDPNGVLGVSIDDWPGQYAFKATAFSLLIDWDQPSGTPTLVAPADGSTTTSTTPTLQVNSVTDPDSTQTQEWYSASVFAGKPTGLTDDPKTNCRSNVALWSSNYSNGTTSWTIPDGVLSDGVTYYWVVAAIGVDPSLGTIPQDVPSCGGPWKFKVDRRLGAASVSPMEAVGPFSVNLANGNVVLSAGSHSVASVGGSIAPSFAYNSEAKVQHGLRATYYGGTFPIASNPRLTPDFTVPAFAQRIDAAVDFDWQGHGPIGTYDLDNFWAQWHGFITVPAAGNYCFGTRADDGTQMWINGINILNNWVDQGATDNSCSSSVYFNAGETKEILLRYYEYYAGASIQLKLYSAPAGVATGVVPTGWLSTDLNPLGPGWSMTAGTVSVSGARASGSGVTLTLSDGSTVEYARTDGGAYVGPAGDGTTVAVDSVSGDITVVDDSGTAYKYDSNGTLRSAVSATDDRSPAATQIVWSGSPPRVTGMTDPVSGSTVTLSYGGDAACTTPPSGLQVAAGQLCKVASWDGSVTDLYYNSNLQLARIVNPGDGTVGRDTTDFAYDGSNRITGVRQPLAADAVSAGLRSDDATIRWEMSYDGSGRASVATAPAPTSGASRQAATFSYNASPPSGVFGESTATLSGLSNPSGFTTKYQFDGSYRTTKVVAAGGQVTQTTYDGNSDRVSYSDTDVGTAQAQRTSTTYDSSVVFNGLSRPTASYGPAPVSLFTGAAPTTTGTVPTSTTSYDDGINGLAAAYWDDTGYTGTAPGRSTFLGAPKAHALLTGSSSWNWGSGSPATNIPNDYFSGRLTGLVYLSTAGTWTFGGSADDALRVTIDDSKAVDTWATQLGSGSTAIAGLAAGWHRISIDFREDTGGASLGVWYTPPAGSQQTIPAANLKPDFGLVTTTVNAAGVSSTTAYSDPAVGLATASSIDPSGLNLTSTVTYEAAGAGAYFRRTARALPVAVAASTSTSTYTPYGASETAPSVTCAGSGVSVSSVSQRGLPHLWKATDPNVAGGPNGIVREQVQDSVGRVVASRVSTDTTWACTQFDARGQVTKQTFPASASEPARTVTTTYSTSDPFFTTVSDATGTISTRVDLLGRVTDTKDVWGTITHTDYDLSGRRTQSTVFTVAGTVLEARMSDYQSTGPAVDRLSATRWTSSLTAITSTVYDFANLKLNAGQSMPTTTGTTLASISFDSIGRPSATTYSSGVVSTQSYDSFGRPSGVADTKSATTLLSDSVTRDLTGRITDQTLDGNDANTSGANFTYDNAGRLTGWYLKDPSSSTTYHGTENYASYTGGAPSACAGNGWGNASNAGLNSNRIESSLQINGGTAAVTKYCYDYADRLQKVITPPGQANPYANGFAYDAHGNATSIGTETRTYDGADRHVATSTGAIATAKTVLEVVGNPSSLTSRDSWVKDQLERAGWTVTVADDNGITASAATGKQLVVITDSVGSATVGGTFTSTAVPAIVSEAFIYDDMGMTGTAGTEFGSTSADQTQISVTTAGAASALGAGLAAGTQSTSTSVVTHAWGKPAAAATKVATLASDSSKSTIFAYDTGATMSTGTAPARRVGWFQYEGATPSLTPNAVALFQSAVAWAANVPTTPTAVEVVGDPAALTSRDTWLRDRLQDAGWTVNLVDDNGIVASVADGKQLVVISESVASGTVGGTFTSVSVPVIVAESFVLDDMGMTGTAGTEFGNTATDQTQVAITTAGSTHPLGAGFPVGNVTTSSASMSHGWGKPSGSSIVAATLPSDSSKATIFGYDAGAAMVTGTAPARRAAWFHYSGAGSSLNDNAAALFDAEVTWAAQTTPSVRYKRDAVDRLVERKVNNRIMSRFSYTATGDTSDLTLDSSNVLVEASISLPGGALYTWRSSTPVWSYPNVHGDLALTTDAAGTKQGPTRVWDPWGKQLTVTAEQDNSSGQMDYGWHGTAQRPLEHQTGAIATIEMGARQYDSSLGRFLEVDPIEGGTANDFAYVTDPINGSDLSGTCGFGNPFKACKRASAADILKMIKGQMGFPRGFLAWAAKQKNTDGYGKGWHYELRGDGLSQLGATYQRVDGDGCSHPIGSIKKQWDARYGEACNAHDVSYDLMRFYNAHGYHVFGKQRLDDWFATQVEALCKKRPSPGVSCSSEGRAAGWATRAGGKPD